MMSLTRRQRELLAFLSEQELCPSFEEMAAALGVASKENVFRLLNALEERGYIRRLRGRARAIEVLRPAEPTGLRVIFGPGHFEDRARVKRAQWNAPTKAEAA